MGMILFILLVIAIILTCVNLIVLIIKMVNRSISIFLGFRTAIASIVLPILIFFFAGIFSNDLQLTLVLPIIFSFLLAVGVSFFIGFYMTGVFNVKTDEVLDDYK